LGSVYPVPAKKPKQPYITMLETGVRKNPSLAVLRRLAQALGVPVAELLG
jgi:transcriptional regulator with XRE-family HTH domain